MNITALIFKVFSTSAAGVNSVFGSPIKPPGPVFDNPVAGLGKLVVTTVSTFVLFALLAGLVYLLWGAVQWVTSGGEQEKLEKARLQMTHAVLGIILVVAVIGIFTVVTGDILGVIRRDNDGNWRFELPTINACVKSTVTCFQSSSVCCTPGSACKETSVGSAIYQCLP
ncbi:MAG: hypothetical protein Q8P72_06445 [Candidatus Roizmanbacteria bacterium]|nr:hypothetical protein [Candidatus Roizmanbacteria bacterium]